MSIESEATDKEAITYKAVLKKYFGYDSFREHQEEIITQFLSGRDCFVMMATGSGKSVCFQLPPLICEKTLLVVSPLISLMQDQVIQLREMGVKTTFLGSAQTNSWSEEQKMRRGEFHLVYLTPEKLSVLIDNGTVRGMIDDSKICGFAIDEAHCLVEWGYDFRPSYKLLNAVRKQFPKTPIMALTATATAPMIRDIVTILGLDDVFLCTTSFDRANLFYTVYEKTKFKTDLKRHFTSIPDKDLCTIIFVNTQKLTTEIADHLVQLGIKACAYHAGMDADDREKAHRDFYEGRCTVICATIAYAMGISLYSVRRIINYGAPSSLECLVQQQGRAGRDGLNAHCYLYYGGNDWYLMDHFAKQVANDEYRMIVKKRNKAVREYCTTASCRRKYVLQYLGETYNQSSCNTCDNCCKAAFTVRSSHQASMDVQSEVKTVVKKVDLTDPARMVCKVIAETGSKYGMGMLIKVLRGSKEKGLLEKGFQTVSQYGCGKAKSEKWWKVVIEMLVRDEVLLVKKYSTCSDGYTLGEIGKQLIETPEYKLRATVQSKEFIEVRAAQNSEIGVERIGHAVQDENDVSSKVMQQMVVKHKSKMDALIELRRKLAVRKKLAPFLIFQDATLNQLVNSNGIRTILGLSQIIGMNIKRMEDYGMEIIECLRECEEGVSVPSPAVTESTVAGADSLISTENKSYNLLKEGYAVSDIAGIRGISEKSVEDHIALVIKRGEQHFPLNYFMTDAEHDSIMNAKKRVGHSDKLRPLVEMVEILHPGISYFKVKVALAFANQNASGKSSCTF